uniref:Uncharacterized protein TCIL3000_3_1050 n=1 Tax=Trypanosoma congolense (strain IL3000) TaxID=1068625 RepID=G0UJX5_TRYCI|nr:unnamed protein product [Trypanosoma congolense IL3000]
MSLQSNYKENFTTLVFIFSEYIFVFFVLLLCEAAEVIASERVRGPISESLGRTKVLKHYFVQLCRLLCRTVRSSRAIMSSMVSLVVAALLVVVAFVLSILSCTVVEDKNTLPLLPLFLSLATPMPFLLCGPPQDGFEDDSQLTGCIVFISGALTVAAPALCVVLYHTGSISLQAFLLAVASQVAVVAAGSSLAYGREAQEEQNYDL